MVTEFEFEGLTVAIPTALHAFVGGNGVGKTRLLRAICAANGGDCYETLDPPFALGPGLLPGVEAEFRRRFPGHDPATSGDGMRRMFRLLILRHRVVGLLAFDNPTAGMHPTHVPHVARVLREIAADRQVLVATHDAMLLNELQPAEVTMLARRDGALRALPIAQSRNFDARAKVYALGELWLSYCDGAEERGLFGDGPDEAEGADDGRVPQ